MSIELNDVRSWVFGASADELSLLAEAINGRRKMLSLEVGMSFAKGDKVWFDAKNRGIIRGTFSRLKQKNAEVIADGGAKWTVSPQLLKRQ